MLRALRGRNLRFSNRLLFSTRNVSTAPPPINIPVKKEQHDPKKIIAEVNACTSSGNWRKIPSLIKDVPIDLLLKAVVEDKGSAKDSLNEILGAMIYSNSEKLPNVLEVSIKDQQLAVQIGVRQLLRICVALNKDLTNSKDSSPNARGGKAGGQQAELLTPAAELAFTKTFSEWLIRASNRATISYLKQIVALSDIKRFAIDRHRIIDLQIEQLDYVLKNGRSLNGRLLGDIAVQVFSRLRNAGSNALADDMLNGWVARGLVHAGNVSHEGFTLAVTRFITDKTFVERVSATVNPLTAAAQTEASSSTVAADEPDSPAGDKSGSSKVGSPDLVGEKSGSSTVSTGSPSEGLNALFGVARGGNSAEAIKLRGSFLRILLVNGKSDKVIEYANQMKKQKLLFGTRTNNTLLSAYISTGQLSRALNTLDLIELEQERVEKYGFEYFNDSKKFSSSLVTGYAGPSSLPVPDFGLNVHSFAVFLTSPYLAVQTTFRGGAKGRGVKYHWGGKQKALPAGEACKVVFQLLQRMKKLNVLPDARLLSQIGEVGRAARDLRVIIMGLDAAHQIVGLVSTRQDSVENVPRSLSFQPNTLRPSQMIVRPDQKEQKRATAAPAAAAAAPVASVAAADDEQDDEKAPLPLTRRDLSLMYHYAIDTARIIKNVDFTHKFLNEMVAAEVTPTPTVMKNVMQSFIEAREFEEVLKAFEQMATLGVERDKRHATALVEALAQLGRLGDAWQGLKSMKDSGNMLMLGGYNSLLSQLLFALSLSAENAPGMRVTQNSNMTKEEMVRAVAEIVIDVAQYNKEKAALGKLADFSQDDDEEGSDAPEGTKSHEAFLAKKRSSGAAPSQQHEFNTPEEFFIGFKKFAIRVADKANLDAVFAALRERAQGDEDARREVDALISKTLNVYNKAVAAEQEGGQRPRFDWREEEKSRGDRRRSPINTPPRSTHITSTSSGRRKEHQGR